MLEDGKWFCDPDFEADINSIYYSNERKGDISWKRPHVSASLDLCVNILPMQGGGHIPLTLSQ